MLEPEVVRILREAAVGEVERTQQLAPALGVADRREPALESLRVGLGWLESGHRGSSPRRVASRPSSRAGVGRDRPAGGISSTVANATTVAILAELPLGAHGSRNARTLRAPTPKCSWLSWPRWTRPSESLERTTRWSARSIRAAHSRMACRPLDAVARATARRLQGPVEAARSRFVRVWIPRCSARAAATSPFGSVHNGHVCQLRSTPLKSVVNTNRPSGLNAGVLAGPGCW